MVQNRSRRVSSRSTNLRRTNSASRGTDRKGISRDVKVGVILLLVGAFAAATVPLLVNSIQDSISSEVGTSVTLEIGVEHDQSNRLPSSYVFPGKSIEGMPVPTPGTVSPTSCSGVDRAWVQDNGGYEADSTAALLTVFAGDSPVVIQSIEVVPVSVADTPQTALVVRNPCGSDLYEPYLSVDLDHSRVEYEWAGPKTDESGAIAADKNPFGQKIPPHDSYSISMIASATVGIYSWKLRVVTVVDGATNSFDAAPIGLGEIVRTGGSPTSPNRIQLDEGTNSWIQG